MIPSLIFPSVPGLRLTTHQRRSTIEQVTAASRSDRAPIWSSKFFIHDVPGVACVCRFKDEHFRFGIGERPMLDTTRHHTKLARVQDHALIAELNRHLAAP